MSHINQSPNSDTKGKSSDDSQPRIKIQRLNAKESKDHSERLGLSTSYLIIGNTLKGGRS